MFTWYNRIKRAPESTIIIKYKKSKMINDIREQKTI